MSEVPGSNGLTVGTVNRTTSSLDLYRFQRGRRLISKSPTHFAKFHNQKKNPQPKKIHIQLHKNYPVFVGFLG